MQEINVADLQPETSAVPVEPNVAPDDTVSTHVLVGQEQVGKLRELSRRTRVAQSEYLREAVDDLLTKYEQLPNEES